MAALVLAGCDHHPDERGVRLPTLGAAELIVRAQGLSPRHFWYLMVHTPGIDSTRVPATGTLAAKDSVAVLLGAAGDTLRIMAYRCATADGAQCAEVVALLQGKDRSRTLLLTAEADGGKVEGIMSVRLEGEAADLAGGAPGAGDRALVRIVEPRATTLDFTSAKGENQISLKAALRGAATGGSIEWRVEPDTGGPIHPLTLVQPASGASSVFLVPQPPQSAWKIRPHPASAAQRAERFKRAALAFRIVATARKGDAVYHSAALVVRQSEIAVIREEYLVFRLAHGPPPMAAFRKQTRSDGDYPFAANNARFDSLFGALRQAWLEVHPGQWQINGLYRNPGHNVYHVARGVSSGAVPASWHQYGCAADLQTFPRDRDASPEKTKEALRFWESLHDEAQLLGFDVEALSSASGPSSGLGHIHIELDCPP